MITFKKNLMKKMVEYELFKPDNKFLNREDITLLPEIIKNSR
jgi:hypothetical protein